MEFIMLSMKPDCIGPDKLKNQLARLKEYNQQLQKVVRGKSAMCVFKLLMTKQVEQAKL